MLLAVRTARSGGDAFLPRLRKSRTPGGARTIRHRADSQRHLDGPSLADDAQSQALARLPFAQIQEEFEVIAKSNAAAAHRQNQITRTKSRAGGGTIRRDTLDVLDSGAAVVFDPSELHPQPRQRLRCAPRGERDQ